MQSPLEAHLQDRTLDELICLCYDTLELGSLYTRLKNKPSKAKLHRDILNFSKRQGIDETLAISNSQFDQPEKPSGNSQKERRDPTQLEATAPPSPPISLAQKIALVDALLACSSIGDQNTRDTILNELPDQLKNNVKHHTTSRTHVLHIVNACLNYPDGLVLLVSVIRILEGDEAIAVQNLVALVESMSI